MQSSGCSVWRPASQSHVSILHRALEPSHGMHSGSCELGDMPHDATIGKTLAGKLGIHVQQSV